MVIEFQNVTKSYPLNTGRCYILRDFSFQFPEGKNLGILGKNGSGKSTMLRLIAGSEYPDSGDILREGKLSWPLGFSGGFSPNLSGEENLRFICRIYAADIPHVTEFVKAFAELGDFFYEPIRNYSNGMRSRLAFGLSMAIDFDVILVDEILGVGDSSFRKKCTEHIERKSEESSIIMVSHEMHTIRHFCDTALLFNDGEITVFNDVEEAIIAYGNL